MIAFRSGSNDQFAVASSMSLISNATIGRPATDLGPGDARGCAYGRCLVWLGGSRRAALVGSSNAGRLCYGRLPGGPPPTIAGLAVAPVSITAASCNRSGLWRSSFSLECKRHHGKVPIAEPLIDYHCHRQPSTQRAAKQSSPAACKARRTSLSASDKANWAESRPWRCVAAWPPAKPTRAGCPRGLP
jgi:hypothetical protein